MIEQIRYRRYRLLDEYDESYNVIVDDRCNLDKFTDIVEAANHIVVYSVGKNISGETLITIYGN